MKAFHSLHTKINTTHYYYYYYQLGTHQKKELGRKEGKGSENENHFHHAHMVCIILRIAVVRKSEVVRVFRKRKY